MPLPVAALAIPAAAGAASSIAGAIGGGKGSKRTPSSAVAPEALAALRAGTAGAEQSLAGLPVPSGQNVIDVYTAIAQKLAEMQAPQQTVNAEGMTQDIAQTTAAALAPQRAETAREYRQAAGAMGPSTALNQARAAQTAEEANLYARLIAETKPKLAQQEFDQNMSRLQASLGIAQAQGSAATTPVDMLQRLRQGATGQLLGAGQAAASVPLTSTVPAWSAGLMQTGKTLAQIAPTMENIYGATRKKTPLQQWSEENTV